MFGSQVGIIDGDHNKCEISAYKFDFQSKKAQNDQPINIEDDVWIISFGELFLKELLRNVAA